MEFRAGKERRIFQNSGLPDQFFHPGKR